MNRHILAASAAAAVLATAFAPASAQVSAPPPPGLVSWWDGDAVVSGSASDIFGSHPASLLAGASIGSGLVGNAFAFNGAGGHLATGTAVLNTTGAFTVEAWILVAPGSSGDRVIVSEIGIASSSAGHFQVRLDPAGRVLFYRRTGAGTAVDAVQTTSTVPLGVWTHMAAVYRGGTSLEIRLNGQRASAVTSTSAYGTVGPVQTTIGADESGQYPFAGAIDEVAVYRRDLSGTEITRIAQAGVFGKTKAPAVPPAGLTSWWNADSACGSYALDAGGGDSLRLENGATRSSAGAAGGAFSFDGSNDVLGADRRVAPTAGAFTVEAWVRPDRLGIFQTIVSEIGTGSSAPGQHMFRVWTDGRLQAYLEGSGGAWAAFSSALVQAGQWSHVAAVYDGASATPLRIYLDGQSVGGSAVASGYTRLNAPVETRIGSAEGRYHFDGRIDEVSYFGRALGGAEIDAIYRAGAFGKDATKGNGAACLSGSGEDFVLTSQVDGAGHPDAPQKTVTAGDFLTVTLDSPGGAFIGEPPFLLAELYTNGAPPLGYPGLASLHLSPALSVVFGPRSSVVGPFLLSPGGLTLGFAIPPGLQGGTLRMQALALTSRANNGVFAATAAHDFRAR